MPEDAGRRGPQTAWAGDPSRRHPHQRQQPSQVERGTRKDQQPVHVFQPTQFHVAEPSDRFQPGKGPFNARSTGLALRIAFVPGGASVEGTAAGPLQILTDMRRHLDIVEIRFTADKTFVPALEASIKGSVTRELGVRFFHVLIQ